MIVKYRYYALAPFIFGASPFGRWVVTHSLADFYFHDHRPAVYMNKHPLRLSDERKFRHLLFAFGWSRIASSAYQRRPTWSSHSQSISVKQIDYRTYSKFANSQRTQLSPVTLDIISTTYNCFKWAPAILREISEETSYQMVRLVFRTYTHIKRTICTSVSLQPSILVSQNFSLCGNSSPSFGS